MIYTDQSQLNLFSRREKQGRFYYV